MSESKAIDSSPGFGPAEATHRGQRNILPYIGATVFGLGLIGGGLFTLLSLGVAFDDLGAGVFGLVCFGGLSLICLVGLIGMIVWATRTKVRTVSIHPEGIVDISGQKEVVLRWEDVKEMYYAVTQHKSYGVNTYRSHSYTVVSYAGDKLVYGNGFSDIEKIGEALASRITATLLPKIIERIQSGETVAFGKLGMNRQGIVKGSQTVPWDEIEEVKLRQGFISIRKQGKWFNWTGIAVSNTPNVFVFLSLADRMVGLE
ncbi:MAG: hypothetical protein GYB68_19720 [Chloroflexi bacterium]|nr:hypothetical protein [Chloroflexota bacterium]